jgi:hypothetical protein
MEGLYNQEQEKNQTPTILSVEQQKKEAGIFVTDKVMSYMAEGMSLLASARRIYEEVKGDEYRREQMAVKLLEYLNMSNEVSLRKDELSTLYPACVGLIGAVASPNSTSSNDDRFLVVA